MIRIPNRSHSVLLLSAFLLATLPLQTQESAVPRTRTWPGIALPAFPYTQPEEVGLSTGKLERLGDEIVTWVANGDLVGAELLIIRNGRAVFHEAFGWADREERRPMRRNSVFAIASMTKSYTATAALMLVDEGLLSLDDPVRRHSPGFPDDSTTIHDLLRHTSGFVAMNRSRHVDQSRFGSLGGWVDSLVTDGQDGWRCG
jgi:CubicO group peptidase (beta-lactamase class C family)